MEIYFKKAKSSEFKELSKLDLKIFPDDFFEPTVWKELKNYWIICDGVKIGSIGFMEDSDSDISKSPDYFPRRGTLYIATVGVIPRYKGYGIGFLALAYIKSYAKLHNFKRISLHTRKSNKDMMMTCRKMGFVCDREEKSFYKGPDESAYHLFLILDNKNAA